MNPNQAIVESINISNGGIPKTPIPSVRIRAAGLEGDGHNHEKHYRPVQAVCLQDAEAIEQLCAEGYPLKPGSTGENLTVRGLDVNMLPIGTVLNFSGGVRLRITRVRPTCYVMDAIDPRLKNDAEGRHGMYAEVLEEGMMMAGEAVTADPK